MVKISFLAEVTLVGLKMWFRSVGLKLQKKKNE